MNKHCYRIHAISAWLALLFTSTVSLIVSCFGGTPPDSNTVTNSIEIFPGSSSANSTVFGQSNQSHLTIADVQTIAAKCPTLLAPAPIVRWRTPLVYGSKTWIPQTLLGTTPAWFRLNERLDFSEGSAFTEKQVQNNGKVCVIGKTVELKLFGTTPALGQEIILQGLNCKIVGVLSPKGVNLTGQDRDDVVLLPWTTAKIYLINRASSSTTLPDENLDLILLAARSSDQIQDAVKQITSALRDYRNVAADQPDDFTLKVWMRKNGDLSDPVKIQTTP